MEFKGKRVLVFGAGISGIGACKLLYQKEADVILFDTSAKVDVAELKKRSGCSEIQVITERLEESTLAEIELAVLSPGIPSYLPEVQRIISAEIPIWGEIELAYHFSEGDVLAITGTNGKTTTTALLGEIVRAYNPSTFVVGNIGNPYTEVASEIREKSVTVAEISSFQLETIHEFKPIVSAILNVTPDHLDRHGNMENYIKAKKEITKNQTKSEICVLNYEDPILKNLELEIEASIFYFSSKQALERGIYIENNCIIYRNGKEVELCKLNELKLLGMHNYENIMAASAMAILYGIPVEIVKKVIHEFEGVAHRIEYVAEVRGVTYYNDSKGTNPDAAIKGIEAMNRPTVLIAGGYDKDSEYDEWIQSFQGKVKALVLLGQTKEKIATVARNNGLKEIHLVESLEEAVKLSEVLSQKGDAVLLSPACASWGMFKNFEERGDEFKKLVNGL